MRLLIVTEAGDNLPSGYIRASSYKELFKADGIDVFYVSRSNPWLSQLVSQPGYIFSRVLRCGGGRLLGYLNKFLAYQREKKIARKARDFDVIYLQKVQSLQLVRALRRENSTRIVYDLNDGLWLPRFNQDGGREVRQILQAVDAVTCDNPFGLEFARIYNLKGFVVPDPPQVELFDRYRSQISREPSAVVIGWVGSPANLFNLYAIWETLEKLFIRFKNITLRLLGCGYDRDLLPPFEKVRYTALPFYSQTDLIQEVLKMDIGLFPLFDVEDSRARGILKATVYMSGESCVVASAIGQNCELITNGRNGFLAISPDEWLERLTMLVQDAELRRQIASAGLQTVRDRFTLRQCYGRLLCALRGES